MSNLAIKANYVGRTYKVKASGKRRDQDKSAPKLLTALDGVDLEVKQGELFGLLGPNGAGKTTLIKICTTLLAPTSGQVSVAGLDVVKDAQAVRHKINMVSGGETSGYGILTVRENLWMFCQFYGIPTKEAYRRIDKLLRVVELEDKASTRISSLSTGQRQRMNFCRGFITDPEVLFLDEPTLGLDVTAARIVRKFTRDWVNENPTRTVLITTHYMAEADELCDRIAIINNGKVHACDTPQNLKKLLQKQPVFKIVASRIGLEAIEQLKTVSGVVRLTAKYEPEKDALDMSYILEDESAIGAAVTKLTSIGGNILSLKKEEPTLEDVFIKLVGKGLTEVDENVQP